ncbi:MAG: 4Fe-4S dicluster domain-containing protein [Mailhella sp.]|jgi:ferredoxin|nr:4Fe-4S dicluster domain-containing protein [Mailhella sp.]
MDCDRRKFLQVVAGTVVVGGGLSGMAGLASGKDDLLRPPGAITEPDFLARCQRCMRCIDACEPAALQVAHITDGIANVGTPILDIYKCIQCMDCMRVCPSGALAKVAEKELRMGVVVIHKDACLTYLNKRRCKICVDACREFKAIKLEKRRWPVVDAKKCTGCGACLRRCPETERGALTVDTSKIKRFDPPKEKVLEKLESRTEVIPQKTFSEWFSKRMEKLGQAYGLNK